MTDSEKKNLVFVPWGKKKKKKSPFPGDFFGHSWQYQWLVSVWRLGIAGGDHDLKNVRNFLHFTTADGQFNNPK